MTMIPDHFTTKTEETDEQNMPQEKSVIQPRPATNHYYARQRKSLVKWSQVITWMYVALEITLGFRVLLRLIGANPANPFTQLIYELTKPFVAPFVGLTVTPGVSGAVLEISSLIGMISYSVLYWLAIRLMWIIFNPVEPGDASRYNPDL